MLTLQTCENNYVSRMQSKQGQEHLIANIAGNHSTDEGETASPSSSYPLTLRASLFPGNHVEVSESYDVPSVFSYFIYLPPPLAAVIVILCLQRWQKACVTCCSAGKGKSYLFVCRVHRRQAK